MKSLPIIAVCIAGLLHAPAEAAGPTTPGAASRPIEAAPLPLTEDEALPPHGRGNLYSDAQVRFCQAQLVRIDAVRPLLNRYEREEVEQFNALVADFNARCGNYRYKGNALEESKAWLEDNRALIERTARDTYMARFPGEPKIARSARKSGSTALAQPQPEVIVSAHADSEAKPAPPASKPAASQETTSASKPPASQESTAPSKPPASNYTTTPRVPVPAKRSADTAKPASVPPRPLPARPDKPSPPAGKP